MSGLRACGTVWRNESIQREKEKQRLAEGRTVVEHKSKFCHLTVVISYPLLPAAVLHAIPINIMDNVVIVVVGSGGGFAGGSSFLLLCAKTHCMLQHFL